MSRRTKKVGITGKYGVRYGASLRKISRKLEASAHAKYSCVFCGKNTVKRKAIGIWKCRGCDKVLAGGAWILGTDAAASAKSTILRLKKANE